MEPLFGTALEGELAAAFETRAAKAALDAAAVAWASSVIAEHGERIVRDMRRAVECASADICRSADPCVTVRVCTLTVPVGEITDAAHDDARLTRFAGASVGVLIRHAGALKALSERLGQRFVARVSPPLSVPIPARGRTYSRCDMDVEAAFYPLARARAPHALDERKYADAEERAPSFVALNAAALAAADGDDSDEPNLHVCEASAIEVVDSDA